MVMADDITLTVRVRDMARGEFQRIDHQLDRLRRNMHQVGQNSTQASSRMDRLGRSMDDVRGRMQRMAATGRTTSSELQHMRNSLRMANRELSNAARMGEITRDQYRRLRNQVDDTRTTFDRLAQNTRRVGGSLGDVGNNGTLVGKTFGNMRAKLIGVAVVLAASLLPTIGALAPMLAGVAAVVGVAALAFSGLSKPTKQLGKDEKEFKKGLKPLMKDFEGLQKTARKALLPELTKSFKNVGKAITAMNPVIKIGGKALGDLVDKVAKGVSSKDFMGPFLKNVKMGTDWLGKFAGSFGTFLTEFFKFGAKSKPALDAWQNLLGGFLDRGLPGMFKNMESGIKGSSDYLNGLASLINDGLLPGLGTLIGKFMEAFGPTLGKILTVAGQSFNEISKDIGDMFTALAPVGKFLGNVVVDFLDLGRIANGVFFDLIKILGGTFLQTITDVFGGDKFSSFKAGAESLSTWVQNNEGAIREFFTTVASTIIDMVNAGVQGFPSLLSALKLFVQASLGSFDVFISGAATAFGWLPGIGDDLKEANKKFDEFSAKAVSGLDTAIGASKDFAQKFNENTKGAHLRLNVDQAKQALEDIKSKLKDPALTKERRAKLNADKSQAEQNVKEAERALAEFNKKKARAKLGADAHSFFDVAGQVQRFRLAAKKAKVTANDQASGRLSFIQRLLNNINGTVARTTVVTSYQQIRNKGYSGNSATGGHARGGPIRRYADGGGPVSGPGTDSSDSIPAMLSDGEYVVRASAVRKYGQSFMDALNSGSLRPQGFARGGHLSRAQRRAQDRAKAAAKAERDARGQMSGQFGISFFGKIAGYQHTPFEVNAGKPQSLGDLVSALNSLRGQIKAAFHGRTEGGLLHRLTSAGKALIKYEKKLGDVNKKLDGAKTKLNDLKDAAASLRDSVTSGVLSATDITKVATGSDKNITMTDVMAQMRQNVDKSSAFAKSLGDLRSKGVSKDIINQIAQAGIEGGGLETATAILSGSSSDIAALNQMQSQINAAAKSAGKTAADSMYGAGIKAAQGLVDGLTKKQKDIEKAMMRIAKAMEKALKHALGIKSPSRVMMKVGHHTAEGFALGIQKNRRVSSAWESMLNTPAGGAARSGAGGGGGQYVIPIYIGGKFFDEVILDTNRRVVRTRGGDVQKVFGK